MKKILALLLGTAVLLAFSACGGDAPPPAESEASSRAVATEPEPGPVAYEGSVIGLEFIHYISRGEESLEVLSIAPHPGGDEAENLIAGESFSSGSITAEVPENEDGEYDLQVMDATGEHTAFEAMWLEDGASVFIYRLEQTGELYLKVVFEDGSSYVLYSDGTIEDIYTPPDDSEWPVYQIINESTRHLTSLRLVAELGQPFGDNRLGDEGLAPGETFEFKYGDGNANMIMFDADGVEYQVFDIPMEPGTPLTVVHWRGGLGLYIVYADGEEFWRSFRDSVTDYSLDAVRPAYFDLSNETEDGTGLAAVYAAPSAGGERSEDLLKGRPLADGKWTEIGLETEGRYDFWIVDSAGSTWRFTNVDVFEFSTMTIHWGDGGGLAIWMDQSDGSSVKTYSAS